jgi:hypothetical protein
MSKRASAVTEFGGLRRIGFLYNAILFANLLALNGTYAGTSLRRPRGPPFPLVGPGLGDDSPIIARGRIYRVAPTFIACSVLFVCA